jgi:hypothetical protein
MNADAAAYSVYFGVDGTLNVQGGYFKETSPTMESIGGTSADAVNLFNEPFLTNGITIAPWYGSYINASGKFFSTDLFQDMDERAAAPANPDANRWRVWVESDGLHILNNAGSEYIFPGGIDPTGHTHSKIVASDGAPDPAWSVDAAGNLAAAGAYSLDVNAGELILDADADTSITADTDDQIDFETGNADRMTLTDAGLALAAGARANEFSIDGTLGGNSDTALPTEKAVKTYIDTAVPAAWTDWTPTVTQSGAVTVTVTFAKYLVVAKKATLLAKLAVTGAGTGGNSILLGGWPAGTNPSGLGAGSAVGVGTIKDTGVQFYYAILVLQGATTLAFYWQPTSNYLGLSPNFALANTDEIHINASWMIA